MVNFNADVIFWDFDGVVKDSVEVKADAFEKLFLSFGVNIAKKARKHHEANGGMSRFDKLPIYLEWGGEVPVQSLIDKYSKKFSLLVKQKVIESNWVGGVLDYFEDNANKKTFFLVTATPQEEIEEIISILAIEHYFKKVIGAPTRKNHAIKMLLDEYLISPEQSVMIGDASSDYEAALYNRVPFVLRKTSLNKGLQEKLKCRMIEDFCDE